MPEVVFCILMALLENSESSSAQISAASGYQFDKYQRVAAHMVSLGWMRKPWNGKWQITERGKIVLAIEVGRRTKLRAKLRVVKEYGRLAHFMSIPA